MKRLVSLFFILWIPVFMASAHAISAQMAFANLLKQDVVESQMLPCHQTTQHKSLDKQTPGTCVVCGFCVVAGSIANFSSSIYLSISKASHISPTFFTSAFHSQTYPPAINPPILN